MATYLKIRRLDRKMIEIGRICVKIAGRDAGLKCVIVDILDDKSVLIDGETRRRKCNVLHLEPSKEVIKIKIDAMKCYQSEIQDFPHPRSEESLVSRAKFRGSSVGLKFAESLVILRKIRDN